MGYLQAWGGREREMMVKDEMQWWIVGGREGRRKLKTREEERVGRKVTESRIKRGEVKEKMDIWCNQDTVQCE